MLAAASSRSDRSLESVKLVLLLESKQQTCPESLKTYFMSVLQQTVDLLRRPTENASTASPEAVSLAVKMSNDDGLRNVIEEIFEQRKISSDKAEFALNSLEASFDPSSQSAHFSKEIYATI